MKRKQSDFSFRGFVALADLIFAVSAGLLLLNPIQFADSPPVPPPQPKPATKSPAQIISLQMRQIEGHLDKLEADSPALQRQAADVLKNE